MNKKKHYLKDELYQLMQEDSSIFEFLQQGSLDGIWYWNLEHPEEEWMSPRFWEILGYDPAEKQHLATEWQDIIHQDDLKLTLKNFKLHCKNPNHPYDQIVRYRHKNGKTVWVRCRGIAIRDTSGKPIRMLGAHNDLTKLKNTELKLKKLVKKLEELSSRDSLTNLFNRRALYERLNWMLSISKRLNICLSVLMIDLDHFKQLNDKYGHEQG